MGDSCTRETEIRAHLEHLQESEYQLWKQRAKQQWIKDGDRNTRYFQSVVKHRRNKNRILALKDPNGQWHSSHQDMSHYQRILPGLVFQQDYQRPSQLPDSP